jgi:hypothetical protein
MGQLGQQSRNLADHALWQLFRTMALCSQSVLD